MEENVLFQKKESSNLPPAQVNKQELSPSPQSQQVTSSPPAIKSGGILGKLIKIIIVILIISGIGFLVYRFVLPIFMGGSGNGNVELTYWGLWESEETMKPLIEEFEKENPNIKVNYEQRDVDKYRQTLQTRVNNGDGPDLFLFHNTWLPMTRSITAPASTSVITPEEFEKVYYPVINNDLKVDGAIYGIPFGFDTLAMFVNDSIFQETGAKPPATWDDFTNTVTAVTVKDEEGRITTYGAGFGAYDNVNRAPDIVSMLFSQNRVDLADPDKTVPNMEEALRFYTDFVTGNDGIEEVWDTAAPSSLVAFAGGKLAIYFGYSWDVFLIKQLNPDLKFSIYPVPKLADDMTVASYWSTGVSNKSEHQDESQKFLAFLAEKETQDKLYTQSSKQREFGLPPARRDMAEMVKDNPLVYPFVAQGENAVSSYFVSDTFDDGLNMQMNAYLANAIRSILGNTSVQSATETLIKGMNQVLDQYAIK